MLNFCCHFNGAYLLRALTMYRSLLAHPSDFHIYFYAFDEWSHGVLLGLDLAHVTVIPLQQLEDPDLLRIKPARSLGEYIWTCTPSVTLHAIETFGLDHCIYVDADLYFFGDPSALVGEMSAEPGRSVMLTEHRYTARYDQSHHSGKYCVQFMYFRGDDAGMAALRWWRAACIDWCYARYEDGRFGDQKYLDDWTSRFAGVHVLAHLGGGVAPWNVQQYRFDEGQGGRVTALEGRTGERFDLIFYHFHNVKFCSDGRTDLGVMYQLDHNTVDLLYRPYMDAIRRTHEDLTVRGVELCMHDSARPRTLLQSMYDWVRRFRYGTLSNVRFL